MLEQSLHFTFAYPRKTGGPLLALPCLTVHPPSLPVPLLIITLFIEGQSKVLQIDLLIPATRYQCFHVEVGEFAGMHPCDIRQAEGLGMATVPSVILALTVLCIYLKKYTDASHIQTERVLIARFID